MQNRSVALMCQHLVGLCITYQWKVEDHERWPADLCSATVLAVGDRHFLVTAGHVLKAIETRLSHPDVGDFSCVLVDTFGIGASDRRHTIPFNFADSAKMYFDDDALGLDFGVIVLSDYYVRLLVANGVVPIRKSLWLNGMSRRCDRYMLVGFPKALRDPEATVHVGGDFGILVDPAIVTMNRIERPDHVASTEIPRFVGQIAHDITMPSLEGMSGGPIFGFRFLSASAGNGPVRTEEATDVAYCAVALQSSWLPTKRVAFGCPLEVVGSLIEAAVADIDGCG